MKLAIIRLSALGDIVQTNIVLQFIKKHYPNCTIDWVCEEKFAEILENHKFINQVIKINLKDKKFLQSFKILKEARKSGYDMAIDFQGLIKSAIVAKILCKNVAGYDKFSIRENFASNLYTKKVSISYKENVIIRYLTLASEVLNFKFSKDEILNKKPCFDDKMDILNLDKSHKNILIIAGSSQKAKIYDKNLQVRLINMLKEKNYKIYISYMENEKEFGDYILSKTNINKLENLELSKLPLAIHSFDLVIGPDSGPTHIAWAMNTKSITIFGYTPHFRNAYETNKNLVIYSSKKIDPHKLDKSDFCINEIKPQDIANLAIGLLDG
ncbi:lipopolysaccharide heptosyltransferase I [Campylobacter sputorum]|uniref:lipopolysaccharide heptosyltransferase I n=1 Tax=Campylobacter sputorum TaxID=206 RepID=UPI00053BF270|nr:lipopolysaccharide heptosyltransferase I [Campylobacter sputorum]